MRLVHAAVVAALVVILALAARAAAGASKEGMRRPRYPWLSAQVRMACRNANPARVWSLIGSRPGLHWLAKGWCRQGLSAAVAAQASNGTPCSTGFPPFYEPLPACPMAAKGQYFPCRKREVVNGVFTCCAPGDPFNCRAVTPADMRRQRVLRRWSGYTAPWQ